MWVPQSTVSWHRHFRLTGTKGEIAAENYQQVFQNTSQYLMLLISNTFTHRHVFDGIDHINPWRFL
jgi:hypothetical protein